MNVVLILAALAFLLLPLLIPAVVLLVGFFVGAHREREHFLDLDRREAAAADVLVTNLKGYPGATPGGGLPPPRLIVGEVTIGSDAMKNWLSKWRKLFGGEMHSYVAMQTRARREARLRVIEQAKAAGYNAVCNLRFDGVDVSGAAHSAQGTRRAATVAVIASGTAYTWSQPQ